MRSFAILLCLTGSALAGEYALLSSGARLQADRHECEGGKVRLYKGSGYIEIDAAQVTGFEVDEFGVEKAAASAPVPAAESAPAPANTSPHLRDMDLRELADAAADKYGLPRNLVRSVMAAESAFQPNAVSPKGAIGPMQLMPDTARQLGVDPHDPVQNIDGGARYLRDLLQRYNYGLWHALAAYNAGPGAVDKYQGIPPYRETLNYVNKIDRAFRRTESTSAGSTSAARRSLPPE